jgi:hypothetical protein
MSARGAARAAGLLALVGCGGKGDDTGSALPPPDPSGRYNVTVLGTSGCDGDPSWTDGWARGPLMVSSEGRALQLDFGDPAALAGELDGRGEWRATGGFGHQGAELTVVGSGAFVEEEEVWTLEAELSVTVTAEGADPCTQDARLSALELQALD